MGGAAEQTLSHNKYSNNFNKFESDNHIHHVSFIFTVFLAFFITINLEVNCDD